MTVKQRKPIDAICQHSKDGSIIPIKIRLTDEDGVCQEYMIQGYRVLSVAIDQRTPDGLYVTPHTTVYECKITVFQRERTVCLYYRNGEGIWSIYM